jgi:hypothetical protein
MLRDDPINAPLLSIAADPAKYRGYLEHGLKYADYLLGYPEGWLSDFYKRGVFVPMLSRVRLALTLIAIKNPENEAIYHDFSSIGAKGADHLSLAGFRSDKRVLAAHDAIKDELKAAS